VHLAVAPPAVHPRLLGEALEDADLRVGDGVGVVVDLRLAHVDAPLVVVVPLDEVRAPLQDVDRLLVDHRRGRVVVHLGDDPRLGRDVLDHEVVGGHRAQADRVGGVALARPVPAVPRPVEQLLVLEVLQDLDEVLPAERLVAHERQLERRALDVVDEDLQVVGVHPALLDRRAEEVVRVLRDELVEGVEFATRTATDVPVRRPARPACCHAEATLPG